MTDINKDHQKGAPVPILDCALAMAAHLLGDRWTLLILRELFYGVRRFGPIKDDLGIPRAALSDRLGKLVMSGILARAPYQEAGRRVHHEYVLTEKGMDLFPALIALMQWGDKHLRQNTLFPISLRNAHTNSELRVALIDENGKSVRHLKDIKLEIR